MERTLVLRCTEFMATSMGMLTKRSTSSALRPFHCVTIMICVLVTSGKASRGVLHNPNTNNYKSTAVVKNEEAVLQWKWNNTGNQNDSYEFRLIV